MLPPVAALIGVVQQQGLEVIHGPGEAGLRRLAGLELLEQAPQLRLLILRQQTEDPLRRLFLPPLLGGQAGGVIGVGVAGVDLHDVVDQRHHHGLRHIDLPVSILLQQVDHDGHVPGVLRVILPAAVAAEMSLAKNVFLLVGLQNKGHLPFKPLPIHAAPHFFLRPPSATAMTPKRMARSARLNTYRRSFSGALGNWR